MLPAKLLLQDIWRLKLSSDDELPDHFQLKCKAWAEELHLLNSHTLPRYMGSLDQKVIDFTPQGFCDASSKAYGGVVFLRIVHHDCSVQVFLVAAKSRVAPIKAHTKPRLELSGALLLTNLLKQVAADLAVPSESGWILLWSWDGSEHRPLG